MQEGWAHQAQGVVQPHHHAQDLTSRKTPGSRKYLVDGNGFQVRERSHLVGTLVLGFIVTGLHPEEDFVFPEPVTHPERLASQLVRLPASSHSSVEPDTAINFTLIAPLASIWGTVPV